MHRLASQDLEAIALVDSNLETISHSALTNSGGGSWGSHILT